MVKKGAVARPAFQRRDMGEGRGLARQDGDAGVLGDEERVPMA